MFLPYAHSNASTYTASGCTRQPQPIFAVTEGEMKKHTSVHVTGGLSKMAVGRADGLTGTVIKHAENVLEREDGDQATTTLISFERLSPTEASVNPIFQKESSRSYMTMVPMLGMRFSVGVGWGHCSAVSSRAGACVRGSPGRNERGACVGAVPELAGWLAGWLACDCHARSAMHLFTKKKKKKEKIGSTKSERVRT